MDGDAVKILHPGRETDPELAAAPEQDGLRFGRGIAGDDPVWRDLFDTRGKKPAVCDLLGTSPDEVLLLEGFRHRDAFDPQTSRVIVSQGQCAARSLNRARIHMRDLVPPPGQLPAKLYLEGVARIVVDEELQRRRTPGERCGALRLLTRSAT